MKLWMGVSASARGPASLRTPAGPTPLSGQLRETPCQRSFVKHAMRARSAHSRLSLARTSQRLQRPKYSFVSTTSVAVRRLSSCYELRLLQLGGRENSHECSLTIYQ